MNRRGFLLSGGALLAGGGLAGCSAWPDQGLWNPCLAKLPRELAEHELVRTAWEGIEPARVWDAHVHLVGIGDSDSGVVLNAGMSSLWNPGQYVRRLFYLNAGCVHEAPGNVDRAYVERMHNLVDGLRPGVKLMLFAFDQTYDEQGRPLAEQTAFYVPNAYARDVARANPQYFEWVASIHPYRSDCVDALEAARRQGARAVKWLPAAMGMDPASPRCDRFYDALARTGIPLISHAGEERAVSGAETHDFGNPLRLRRALDAGVRVVVAHCASIGSDRDLDAGPNGPVVESFTLFARLMEEARYQGRLYGDISAVTQLNRAGTVLAQLIERPEWHARLLNGSDYPLPGVMPIFSVDYVVSLKLLPAEAAPVLREIRAHNPLLFDFVLKRHLRSGGRGFDTRVFLTRSFFAPELG